MNLDEIKPELDPTCPTCGKAVPYYGGTAGYICCEWKILVRNGGWFDDARRHVRDERLAGPRQDGGRRDVSGRPSTETVVRTVGAVERRPIRPT